MASAVLLFLLFGSGLITKLQSAAVISRCNTGDRGLLRGVEYRIFSDRKSHHDALETCRSWGGGRPHSGLVDILNEDIQACLEEMITTSQYSEWIYNFRSPYLRALRIGGSDSTNEHDWRWGNKEVIPLRGKRKFEKWGRFEPNNYGQEDCLAMLHSDINRYYTLGTWLDLSCRLRLPFICQRDVSPNGEAFFGMSVFPHKEIKKSFESCPSGVIGQSPVNLYATTDCSSGFRAIMGWDKNTNSTIRWKVQNINEGEYVKIFFEPERTVYTMVETYEGTPKKYYVEYARLKWGTGKNPLFGSEHTVQGRRRNLEFQIYHYRDAGETKRQALAFLLVNSGTVPTFNRNWEFLIEAIGQVQNRPDPMDVPYTPETGFFMKLLSFNSDDPLYTLGIAIRYEGSMTVEPCTSDVMWTVYTRTIKIALGQLSFFERYSSVHRNRIGYRPLQPTRTDLQCIVR